MWCSRAAAIRGDGRPAGPAAAFSMGSARRCSSSQTGCGYLISTQASAGIASIVRRTFLSTRIVTENRAPAR